MHNALKIASTILRMHLLFDPQQAHSGRSSAPPGEERIRKRILFLRLRRIPDHPSNQLFVALENEHDQRRKKDDGRKPAHATKTG